MDVGYIPIFVAFMTVLLGMYLFTARRLGGGNPGGDPPDPREKRRKREGEFYERLRREKHQEKPR